MSVPARKAIRAPFAFLAALAVLVVLLAFLYVGEIVKEAHEEYAGQDATLNIPLTDADRLLVPKVVIRKKHEKPPRITRH